MGKLIHQDECGLAGKCSVQIEFRHGPAAVFNKAAGKSFHTLQERFCLLAAVSLHDSRNHVDPVCKTLLRRFPNVRPAKGTQPTWEPRPPLNQELRALPVEL